MSITVTDPLDIQALERLIREEHRHLAEESRLDNAPPHHRDETASRWKRVHSLAGLFRIQLETA